MNPDFDDFETCQAAHIVDNRSFLSRTRRRPGTASRHSPARRAAAGVLFKVIFERPIGEGLVNRARWILGLHAADLRA